MNNKVRNSILTILCGAMIAAAGSCATAVTYPVTVDGYQFRAGLYILQQQQALSEATSKLASDQPDLDTSAENFNYLDQTLDGKKFADWVNDKTLEICRSQTAVNRLFDQYGLSLTAEEIKSIDSDTNRLWTEEDMYAQYFYGVDVVGKYYEKFGVGEQSFKDEEIIEKKREKLFDHLYGAGGEKAANEAEVSDTLTKDYIAVNYFLYELEEGESAQSYADRIAGGESYEEVYKSYNEEVAKIRAAERAAEDAAASAEDDSEDVEDVTEDNTVEIGGQTFDTTVELAEKDSLIQIIKLSTNLPSEEFVKQVTGFNNGDVKVITETIGEGDDAKERTYIVQKLDILSVPAAKTDPARDSIRENLKKPEFEELLRTTGEGYTLTKDGSISLYTVNKLLGE